MLWKLSPPLALSLLFFSAACEPQTPPEPEQPPIPQVSAEQSNSDEEYRWLPQGQAEKFHAIEEQFGGFSQTMWEVGYRYNELYWAGVDRNWGYAEYQLEHIVEAIEAGMIRRPARAESSRPFIEDTAPALQATIEAEDGEAFDAQFESFTAHCNNCHVQERVPFINVAPPQVRLSPAVQPN